MRKNKLPRSAYHRAEESLRVELKFSDEENNNKGEESDNEDDDILVLSSIDEPWRRTKLLLHGHIDVDLVMSTWCASCREVSANSLPFVLF